MNKLPKAIIAGVAAGATIAGGVYAGVNHKSVDGPRTSAVEQGFDPQLGGWPFFSENVSVTLGVPIGSDDPELCKMQFVTGKAPEAVEAFGGLIDPNALVGKLVDNTNGNKEVSWQIDPTLVGLIKDKPECFGINKDSDLKGLAATAIRYGFTGVESDWQFVDGEGLVERLVVGRLGGTACVAYFGVRNDGYPFVVIERKGEEVNPDEEVTPKDVVPDEEPLRMFGAPQYVEKVFDRQCSGDFPFANIS